MKITVYSVNAKNQVDNQIQIGEVLELEFKFYSKDDPDEYRTLLLRSEDFKNDTPEALAETFKDFYNFTIEYANSLKSENFKII